jgi:serine/threonine protein kinase
MYKCTNNFTSKVLGEGAFGKVYFGWDQTLQLEFAVKQAHFQIPDQDTLDQVMLSFKKEISVSFNCDFWLCRSSPGFEIVLTTFNITLMLVYCIYNNRCSKGSVILTLWFCMATTSRQKQTLSFWCMNICPMGHWAHFSSMTRGALYFLPTFGCQSCTNWHDQFTFWTQEAVMVSMSFIVTSNLETFVWQTTTQPN